MAAALLAMDCLMTFTLYTAVLTIMVEVRVISIAIPFPVLDASIVAALEANVPRDRLLFCFSWPSPSSFRACIPDCLIPGSSH